MASAAAAATRKQNLPDDVAAASGADNDDPLLPSRDDVSLSTTSHLTRQELLRRRLTRTRKLSRVYRDHFWTLMEDVRAEYRHYYWTYGISPFENGDDPGINAATHFNYNGEFSNFLEDCGETNNFNAADNGVVVNYNNNNGGGSIYCDNGGGGGGGGKLGLGEIGSSYHRCAYSTCKSKAMALTSFCHLHILADPHQKLYKACNAVIKAPVQGPILCGGKPILSSAVPSLCNGHLTRTLKDVKQALKRAGVTPASSGRLSLKFHVLVAEYVQLIQSKRRTAQKRQIDIKDESSS